MKIVIAPQAFKESRTGLQVAKAIEIGVRRVWPDADTVLVPVADGGDGTLDTLVEISGGITNETMVTGPMGEKVNAKWGEMGDGTTAVIEMAQSSGLARVDPSDRDPRTATTFGLGELFKTAMDKGKTHFIVGIGGSATNDGGAGFAQALGAALLDEQGEELPAGGSALARLHRVDASNMDDRLKTVDIQVACDVNNPLCGDEGASAVFGPQKGATPEVVAELDTALQHFADIVRRDLGADVATRPGAGAAGGLGAGLMAFAGATLRSGADIVLEAVQFQEKLKGADLVIVGEGMFDNSTFFDKAPAAVAKRAAKQNVPVIGVAGGLSKGFERLHSLGISAMFSIAPGPITLEEAMTRTDELLEIASEEACRAFAAGRQTVASG